MGWLLLLGICVLMTAAWWFGRGAGYDEGYNAGYIAGNNKAIEKMAPGSVRVIRPER